MTTSLDSLFNSMMKGSKELYDGLLAVSLNGQALVLAIMTHLAQLALLLLRTLLCGLCDTAGLGMECVTDTLSTVFDKLLVQAEVIGMAMEHLQSYWCMMLNGLPTGCHMPLSSTCWW